MKNGEFIVDHSVNVQKIPNGINLVTYKKNILEIKLPKTGKKRYLTPYL